MATIISGSHLDLDFIYCCCGDIYSFLSIVIFLLLLLLFKENCLLLLVGADWIGLESGKYFSIIIIIVIWFSIHNDNDVLVLFFSVFSYFWDDYIQFAIRLEN